MPDMPAVVDEFDIEMPETPRANLALREGEEERYGAGMRVEDDRRREATLEELRRQMKMLGEGQGASLAEVAFKFARSPSARRRQIAVRKEVEKLQKQTFRRGDRWEGPCAPCTLINLNPVDLKLFGELQRYTVPAAGQGLEVLNLSFKGRTFPSSYITFRTAHVMLAHTGTQNDTLAGVDTPAMEARHIPPLGLAHQFYSHYVEGAPDAQYMGGILMFEGDIHTLDKKRLAASESRIWVPKQEITLDGMGDAVYTVESLLLSECMGRTLTTQRKYAEGRIAEGHRYATSQSSIERNQLNNDHITWHNWALNRGYIEKPYSWASEQLQDSPMIQAVYCPDCRTRQENPQQYFCTSCNAPFDALQAFLAGKTVSPDRLAMYEGEEWNAIVTETARRKAKIAILNGPNTRARVRKPVEQSAQTPAGSGEPEDADGEGDEGTDD